MYAVDPFISIIYFLIVVYFGSYFLLNLILAVIMEAFTKMEQEEHEKLKLAMKATADKRMNKYVAIRKSLKMIRLYLIKRSLIEHAGFVYKFNFFDLVFEVLKREKYGTLFKQELN